MCDKEHGQKFQIDECILQIGRCCLTVYNTQSRILNQHFPSLVTTTTFLLVSARMLGTQEYWSVKIDSRDGFSGSPVYNSKAEVVGVFSGYDWSQKLALISPSIRAQKLLEEYNLTAKP